MGLFRLGVVVNVLLFNSWQSMRESAMQLKSGGWG